MKTRLRSIIERTAGYFMLIGALLGILPFFYTKVDRVQKSSMEDKKKRISELKTTLSKAEDELAQRKTAYEKINQQLEVRQKEVREKFERLLDKEINYPLFIEQVQRKAKALDIDILNSQYDPPARVQGAPATYLEFKFTLNVRGNYEKVKQFIWEMENALGRFVKIGKMTIKAPICDMNGKMNMTMILSTFFLP